MKLLLIIILSFYATESFALKSEVSSNDCFDTSPFERPLKIEAEKLIREILSREAIYTLLGNFKPASNMEVLSPTNGYSSAEFYESIRSILPIFNCGGLYKAYLHEYKQTYRGRSLYSLFIFNLEAFRSLMISEATFFSGLGDVYDSFGNFDPEKVLMAIDQSDFDKRHYGLGLLFGYPKDAIDFFIHTETLRRNTGFFTPRDFLSIPTLNDPFGRFRWAVPKNHKLSEDEKKLIEQSMLVYERFEPLQKRLQIDAPSKALRALVKASTEEVSALTNHCQNFL